MTIDDDDVLFVVDSLLPVEEVGSREGAGAGTIPLPSFTDSVNPPPLGEATAATVAAKRNGSYVSGSS